MKAKPQQKARKMENPSSTKSLIRKVALFVLIPLVVLGCIGFYYSRDKSKSSFDEGWYQTFNLKNGMQVIVVPNHKIPAVTQMVWYKVGAVEDPAGKSGLAHFLEHLMFKGTPKHPKGEFSRLVEQNGGHENAFTSHDYTAYYQVISKEKLPLIMELESDRMRNLILDEKEVLSERDVILEERKMRYDNQPRMLLKEQIENALYPGTPYHIQAIGWEKEMEGLTREDALAFYKKYYAPNNVILIVAGDVKSDEVEKLANKYYAPLEMSKDIKPRPSFPASTPIIKKDVVLKDGRVKEPEFWKSYIAPNYNGNEDGGDYYSIVLLTKILGEGNLSRLYQRLVVEKKTASMTGADYDGVNYGPGQFEIYAIPANGASMENLQKDIDEEVKRIIRDGIEDAELELAKKSLIAEQTYAHEGLQSLGVLVGQLAVINIDPDFITTFPDKINAISAEQIQIAAQKLFVEKNSVTGVLSGK